MRKKPIKTDKVNVTRLIKYLLYALESPNVSKGEIKAMVLQWMFYNID